MAPSFEPLNGVSPDHHSEISSHQSIKEKLSKAQVNGADGGPVQTPTSPLPSVKDLDSKAYPSEDALLADIVESMRASGGCVIRNLVDPALLKEIEGEVRPWLNKAEPWNGDFWPPETRKVMGLMGKSKAFAINVVGNPLWQKVCEHFLTSVLKDYYVGSEVQHSVCGPQLNNTVVFSVNGGAKAQVLHRDDVVHHTWPAAASTHSLGRDNGIGFFVAGKRSTRANGATRFVPGSHLWDYSQPPPPDSSCAQPELEPGDALMMFSGCYHGASANSTKDEERLVYSTFSTRGYLRQEENQYLACERDAVLALPDHLKRFMGYQLARPFMGWVEMDDPIKVIDPNAQSLGDLW